MKARLKALCLALLWPCPASAAAPSKPVRLTILHTNDIHGWIMARPDKDDRSRRVGGMPALAAEVKRRRAEGPALLLDAGDWFQGTPEGTIPRGKALVELFNALGYDALVVGNHDYDFGEENLKDLVAGLKMPVLGANVMSQATGAGVSYLRPYVIKEVGGVKVGIYGLLTANMRHLAFAKNVAGLDFADEIETARRMVAELRSRGATVIIQLGHVGFEQSDMAPFVGDKTIAAKVPGIDLIIGGHSHTFLREPFRDPAHGTLIVQAGCYLADLGVVILDIDPATGKVAASSARLEELRPAKGEDPETAAIVDKYERQVSGALDVVIATAAATLRRDRLSESAMGDWITDCERRWTKTQVAFQNAGGIRADLNEGPVRLRDIFNVMPFDNALVTMNLTGRGLAAVLERGVSGHMGLVQVSGLSLRYRQDAPEGSRVRDVTVAGRPLDPEGTYSATAVDFMVQGGDGYSMFSSGTDKAFTENLLRDVLAWCAREHSPIRPPAADRIKKEAR